MRSFFCLSLLFYQRLFLSQDRCDNRSNGVDIRFCSHKSKLIYLCISHKQLDTTISVTRGDCSLSAALPSQALTRQDRVAAPSIRYASLASCWPLPPTAPSCFRRWRRSSPLLPKGEPLAYRTAFCQTPKVYSDVKDSALLQRAAASEQASLSSCCESLSQGTTFYDNKSFVRPAWALPVRQWLPLWGSWQSHQALTERALGKMIFTAKNPFWLSVVRVPLYF